ncbi:hypothetical protein [Cystobacter ferrugineus]|nr:hypothetical protein [Cystobacter ferrugineus]
MLAPPFEGYFADRYLMDFYDTRERGICSRMHLHTGLRFVRMMTGPDTTIRVSSLSPLTVRSRPDWTTPLHAFVDRLPDTPDTGSVTTGTPASLTGTPPGTVQSKLEEVTFSLADLGVTNPTSVSAATGLRLVSATLDPSVVGLYTVP